MSVDKTIEELSYTLAQLGMLVGQINAQLIGITTRVNATLDTVDASIATIANEAGVMTHQIALTIAQVPHAWIFYLLLISLIIVFCLLSIVLLIQMIIKFYEIYAIIAHACSHKELDQSIRIASDNGMGRALHTTRIPNHHISSGRYNLQTGLSTIPYNSIRGADKFHSFFSPFIDTMIDNEITNIFYTLNTIHKTLYKVNWYLNKTIPSLDIHQQQFKKLCGEIVRDVTSIRSDVVKIASKFPINSSYLTALIISNIILWFIIVLLAAYIIHLVRSNFYTKKRPKLNHVNLRLGINRNRKQIQPLKNRDDKFLLAFK